MATGLCHAGDIDIVGPYDHCVMLCLGSWNSSSHAFYIQSDGSVDTFTSRVCGSFNGGTFLRFLPRPHRRRSGV